MNNKTQLLGFTIVIVLIITGFWYLDRKAESTKIEQREYWENKNFKTDTLKVDIQYDKLPKPEFKYTVPPAQVYYYNDTTLNHVSLNLNDSLIQVIDSLKNSITEIKINYLKLYPKANKLIYGEFSADSLKLDLLGIDGRIRTELYGVNYDRFHYQYRDGAFKASEINKHKPMLHDWYAYTGYDPFFKAPVLGTDYSIYRRRLRLKGNAFTTVERIPQLSGQITIGLKLK